MSPGIPILDVASRIYFGIVHPIQYNIKVKELGYVLQNHIPTLISNWRSEEAGTQQHVNVTASSEISKEELSGTNELVQDGNMDLDGEDDNSMRDLDPNDSCNDDSIAKKVMQPPTSRPGMLYVPYASQQLPL
jgi:hypothetical protein